MDGEIRHWEDEKLLYVPMLIIISFLNCYALLICLQIVLEIKIELLLLKYSLSHSISLVSTFLLLNSDGCYSSFIYLNVSRQNT
jgi:hypothetical protein